MPDIIYSPVEGRAIKMEEVNDPMFSQKMLGDGVAVYPTFSTGLFAKPSNLYAPCDGEVILVFAEKHAIGIRMQSGAEILIHMGIDTVELKGEPFNIICKVGDNVKHGQKIGEVNWKKIQKSGKDTIVPVIWTNNDQNTLIDIKNNSGQVNKDTQLFAID